MARTFRIAAALLFGLAYFLPCQEIGASESRYACKENLIEVMFDSESRVRLRDGTLIDLKTNALAGVDRTLERAAWHEWRRNCTIPEERLDAIQADGEANSGKPVYNLNNIYHLRIAEGSDIWAVGEELEALPGIVYARPVPLPPPLPQPGNLTGGQYYTKPAPTGIDAWFSWPQAGGDGSGVTVCDLEYSWNTDHHDLTKAQNSQINPNVVIDPFQDDNHGTAVLGEIVSDQNGWGTRGICYEIDLKTCGTNWYVPGPPPDTIWNPAGAIAYAIDSLTAGDVILIEQQWDYQDPTTSGTYDFIPIEWYGSTYPAAQWANPVYVAIVNAVANGIHVIECGGNGDAPNPNSGYNTDNLSWFGDSGAIIVGAGGWSTSGSYPADNLERISWSSYGSRFNLQGQGENVMTTGYGDYYNEWPDSNYDYTWGFAGTSSAAPVVAGAVASCVAHWKATISSTPPTPAYMRDLLTITGTPQLYGNAGRIGPRPDLRAAYMTMAHDWVDVTGGLPLKDPNHGRCVAWGDYDGDGDDDLYLTNQSAANRLFRNDGAGGFADVAAGTPLADAGQSMGAAWGDYDNDRDLDLYLANTGSETNRLFRNDGAGGFVDVAPGTPMADAGSGQGVGWADYDNDGDLDLYLANGWEPNRLFRNDAAQGFVNVAGGTSLEDSGNGFGVAWGDYDNDGDADLYLTNNTNPNVLYRNDGASGFVDVANGTPLANSSGGVQSIWGDHDSDGDLDLYLSNTTPSNILFRNDGGGGFADVTTEPLGHWWGDQGCDWGDYDNDGDLDLYLVGSGANLLFRNDGMGGLVEWTGRPLYEIGSHQGVAFADYDSDGDIDLYLASYADENRLYRNDGKPGTGNHWLHVDLAGSSSNSFGIGAHVRVVSGGNSQLREVSASAGMHGHGSITAEFGLGSATSADTVEVRWPSGTVTVVTGVTADRSLLVYEDQTSVDGAGTLPGPVAFRTHPNVPNPFNPLTLIRYELAERAKVRLSIYNVAGRTVRVLLDQAIEDPGLREVPWDGRDDSGRQLASGVYLYRLEVGSRSESRRMMLIR